MNIIISGISCSGKTTISNEIPNSLHFEQDWYFKDKKEIPLTRKGYLFDSPNAFHMSEFKNDVENLLEYGTILIPSYDIKTNNRISKTIKVSTKNINIFEGLHTINELKHIRDSIKVFMDTPLEECLKRRIQRDTMYGISEQEIIRYFYEVMLPMYKSYIEPQKEYADFIIKGDEDKQCLLKKLQIYY